MQDFVYSKAWGSIKSAPGINILAVHAKSVFVWTTTTLTPVHSKLTPKNTLSWLPETPSGLIFKILKAKNHNYKNIPNSFVESVHLIISIRFYGQKLAFNLKKITRYPSEKKFTWEPGFFQ